MVFSNAKQPADSYRLWTRFRFPIGDGSRDAVAVPKKVADQLNAAFSVMLAFIMVHFWTVVVGLALFFYLRRKKNKLQDLHPLAVTFWNARADLIDTVWEIAGEAQAKVETLWAPALLFLIVALWVGQTAMGILVPPLLLCGNAAPANPESLYMPTGDQTDLPSIAKRVALEIPWAFRALGVAEVDNDELRKNVQVSEAISLGTDNDSGGDVLRVDYHYNITAADFGLQRSAGFTLYVSGACVTDYSWYLGTGTEDNGKAQYLTDVYQVYDDPHEVSVLDGLQPMAFFFDSPNPPPQDSGNASWAVLASTVNRTSFTSSHDPWYLTGPVQNQSNSDAPAYSVQPGRPALSCWENDVWSYGGRNATITSLETLGLPSPSGITDILVNYFSVPMIRVVGSRLGVSSLQSSTTAIDGSFDAGASSLQKDLERLVLATYIASTNVFTDTTLFPRAAESQLRNELRDESGQVPDATADFVVYTQDAAVVDIVVLIAIPTVLVAVWLCSMWLMYFSPVRVVRALEGGDVLAQVKDADPDAALEDGPEGPKVKM